MSGDDSGLVLGAGFTAGLIVVVTLVFLVFVAVGFAYVWRRHRVFTHGVRGTGLVVDVRRSRLYEQRSVVERPTERVVVATAAVPSGVLTDQKLPAGQYRPGQVVPVVQHPTDPRRLYVDRPDLERSALAVYAMGAALVVMPLVAVRGVVQVLSGGVP